MKRFEYEQLPIQFPQQETLIQLNAFGSCGWELVGLIGNVLILKREITDEPAT